MTTATIPAVLDAERRAQGITHAELARRANLPPTTVYDVLIGRRPDPQASRLLALLAGLGRDLPWLHRQGIRAETFPEKTPQ